MFRHFLLLVVLAPVALVLGPTASAARLTRSEASLLREMNRARAAHGLGTLRADDHLESAARAHSREMIRTGSFAHGAFGTRMLQFKVQGSFAGENLAWGVGARGTARGIVAAWLASPGHRANLLRRSFRRVGVGALVGSFRGVAGANVVTADFAG
jgi:uncharacterized protein YkwD